MRKVKIKSTEDMELLPEDEWVDVPDGLHARFVYSVDRVNNKLIITLLEEVAKKIGNFHPISSVVSIERSSSLLCLTN